MYCNYSLSVQHPSGQFEPVVFLDRAGIVVDHRQVLRRHHDTGQVIRFDIPAGQGSIDTGLGNADITDCHYLGSFWVQLGDIVCQLFDPVDAEGNLIAAHEKKMDSLTAPKGFILP